MTYLYHYCATWFKDGHTQRQGGVIRSHHPVTFENYKSFEEAVSRQIGNDNLTLTSLSVLGTETND